MVLFNQPTQSRNSIFTTSRVFTEKQADSHDPHGLAEEDDEIIVPVVDKHSDNTRKYLAGERLLQKINKEKKKDLRARRKNNISKLKLTTPVPHKLSPKEVKRISKSLSRTINTILQ